MDKLILFDINDTLVRDTKDVSEYVAESIRNIYGTLVEVSISKYRGMTSQEIAEAVLRENGMPQDEIDQKLIRYIEDAYYSYYNVAGHDWQIVLDGARELLEELLRKDALIGIATGEPERIARFRLEKTEMSRYFRFGAFGNDAKDAKGIITKALEKASALEFVGDAALVCSYPHLIEAAKEVGLKSVGVSNGRFSAEELKAAGADLTIKSLKERGKIFSLVQL